MIYIRLKHVTAVTESAIEAAVPEPDRDSVDLRMVTAGPRRPALDLQQGHQGRTHQDTVTVHVPEANVFNVEALQKLMEQSRRGEI